jgi:hypothetical protein
MGIERKVSCVMPMVAYSWDLEPMFDGVVLPKNLMQMFE